jgi:uncharacterized protein YjbI with pentapeptide repeats
MRAIRLSLALIPLGLALAALATGPAAAQNPSEIAAVRSGRACPGCNLFQADFSRLRLKGVNLKGARLRQASFSASSFLAGDLSKTDLRDVDAYGALFTGTSFRGADLTNAVLVGAVFGGADLSGARLQGANLSGAELQRSRGLTRRQIAAACGDETTLLPRGLLIQRCR